MATPESSQGSSQINDPYALSSSDNPGIGLTSTKFTGVNFLGWSRTIKMALGAKLKLGFIDGSLPKPKVTSDDYHHWIRCDYMVTCWILNSMVQELFDAFLYAQSAQELWSEICERFGHTNAPLIYQIQHDLNETTQGSSSVSAYFTKLKKCWDELQALNGIPNCSCGKLNECTCGIVAKYAEIEGRNKLMQFLMRLNDDFESVRGQILSMDPLPSVSKAFYIIQQIETQRNVTRNIPDSGAFFASNNNYNNQSKGKRDDRKQKTFGKRYCRHCNSEGHTYDQCFERIGYPDWYKERKNKKSGNRIAAHASTGSEMNMMINSGLESPFDHGCGDSGEKEGKGDIDQKLVAAVCHEMMKLFKGKAVVGDLAKQSMASVNFAGPYK